MIHWRDESDGIVEWIIGCVSVIGDELGAEMKDAAKHPGGLMSCLVSLYALMTGHPVNGEVNTVVECLDLWPGFSDVPSVGTLRTAGLAGLLRVSVHVDMIWMLEFLSAGIQLWYFVSARTIARSSGRPYGSQSDLSTDVLAGTCKSIVINATAFISLKVLE